MSDRRDKKVVRRHLGEFSISGQGRLVGEVVLDGPNTSLKVHSTEPIRDIQRGTHITGMSYSGEFLTLMDCVNNGTSSTWNDQDVSRHQTDIFPHHVIVGRRHLDPANKCIEAVQFTVPDATSLFYDWNAFGHVVDAKPIIDQVLSERRKQRAVETGDYPEVAYFTGKYGISEVTTRIGKISASHTPRMNMGGPRGVYIKNRITISIEPETLIDFQTAVGSAFELYSFLSMAAGRPQQIKEIRIQFPREGETFVQPAVIYPSFYFGRDTEKQEDSHHWDYPLDPVNRKSEFDSVLADWMSRNSTWGDARGRYIGCIQRATFYDPDRLIAAANMFELLPLDAVPEPAAISKELSEARNTCKEILRKLDRSQARDGALDALGRLGRPSLRDRIDHRAHLVTAKLPEGSLKDLEYVIGLAIKRRNFYVHGSDGGVDMKTLGSFTPFLTDTLEFIFAASDLVQAGWDIAAWDRTHRGWGHSFARYRNNYEPDLLRLKDAIPPTE